MSSVPLHFTCCLGHDEACLKAVPEYLGGLMLVNAPDWRLPHRPWLRERDVVAERSWKHRMITLTVSDGS